MIQLRVLSGKMAGTESVARRFPFRVGRSRTANLRIEDDGIWDDHLTLMLGPQRTIVFAVQQGALVIVNGAVPCDLSLRNGDIIEMGAVRLQFGLSPTRQKGLRIREGLVWMTLTLVALAEVGLIYWLLATD